jgi:hypothetical protein
MNVLLNGFAPCAKPAAGDAQKGGSTRTIDPAKKRSMATPVYRRSGRPSSSPTTEQFTEHASVAAGASDLFVKIFGSEAGHVRLVYGVQSLPIGAPRVFDTIFEIAP